MRTLSALTLSCLLATSMMFAAASAFAEESTQSANDDVVLLLNGYHGADEAALRRLASESVDVRGILAAICLADDQPSYLRARALSVLGLFDDESNIEIYSAALRSQNDEVRHAAIWYAAVYLGERATSRIAPVLQDADPELRVTAALALLRIDTAEARNLLRARLQVEDNPRVRRTLQR